MRVPRSFALAGLCLGLLTLSAAPASAQETKPNDPPGMPQPEAAPETVYALMKTSEGDILLALNQAKAPISVENFLAYAESERYDGTIFHRVIANFMIQGGGFEADLRKRPTDPPIKNEWRNGLSNERGTIAMARLGGRADSATNQFFINVQDNPALDQPRDGAGYAVFGKVVAGMGTVDAIRAVTTTNDSRTRMRDVPVEPVTIESVRKISDEDAKALIEKEKAAAGEGAASKPDN